RSDLGALTKTASRKSRDATRSADAFRKAHAAHRQGATYEQYCATVRDDPATAGWYTEKGTPRAEYGLRRAWQRAAPPEGPPWTISLKAPYDSAKLFLRALFTTPEGRAVLHRHRGGFYLWNGAAYPEADEAEVRAQAYEFINQCEVLVLNEKTKQWER